MMTTGDGGMITTNNLKYDEKSRLLRQHGMSVTDTARHNAKEIIFEEYVTTGFNYRMTDIQAAVGKEQLKRLPDLIKERRDIAKIYSKKLENIPWMRFPSEPEYCKSNWQSYPVSILKNAPLSRNELMQYLLNNDVSTRPGITNIHNERAYVSKFSLKNSEWSRDSVILLPLFNGISEEQIEYVTKAIKNA